MNKSDCKKMIGLKKLDVAIFKVGKVHRYIVGDALLKEGEAVWSKPVKSWNMLWELLVAMPDNTVKVEPAEAVSLEGATQEQRDAIVMQMMDKQADRMNGEVRDE